MHLKLYMFNYIYDIHGCFLVGPTNMYVLIYSRKQELNVLLNFLNIFTINSEPSIKFLTKNQRQRYLVADILFNFYLVPARLDYKCRGI